MRYTYTQKGLAHYGRRVVIIPDQVMEDQKGYDGKMITAIRQDGRKIRVKLRGDLYGLHGPGTGAPVVASPYKS